MSGRSTLKSFAAMMAEAKLPERTVEVCLRGDLAAEHEQAERDLELEQEKRKGSDSKEAGGQITELVARIEALEAEMRENTYTFVLRALPKPKWRALKAQYPPRHDHEDEQVRSSDLLFGVNEETFHPVSIRACVVDPELSDEEWTELFEERLTDRQFNELSTAAYLLNQGEISVPFSRAASQAKRLSGSE